MPEPSTQADLHAQRTTVRVVKQVVTNDSVNPPEDDHLAIEDPLSMILDAEDTSGERTSKELALTMRTPGHDEDLIRGFLFCERIITAAADKNVVLAKAKDVIVTGSPNQGRGKGVSKYPRIAAAIQCK